MNTEQENQEVQFLFELYRTIGKRICEKIGHDWQTIRPSDPPANGIKWDRCARCNDTRHSPENYNSSGSTSVTYEHD